VATEILTSSNVLPQATLGFNVDEAATIPGSQAQTNLFRRLIDDLALALGVAKETITASGSSTGSGRRRAQSTVAMDITFTVDVVHRDAAMTKLSSQLNQPDGVLMGGGSGGWGTITSPDTLAFTFSCRVGLYRPLGVSDCQQCAGNSVPNTGEGSKSCTDCGAREAPDPDTGARCVCAESYYNSSFGTSRGPSSIKCYDDGQRFVSGDQLPLITDVCMPCNGMACITCAIGEASLNLGYSISETSLAQQVKLDLVFGQRAVYYCPGGADTCTGDLTQPCKPESTGPLCAICAEGFSRNGLVGKCTECSDSLSVVWVVLGGILAISAAVAALYIVGGMGAGNAGKIQIIIVFAKIGITLIQILTQLDVALALEWPDTFRHFINILRIFSLDFLGFIDIGCLTTYSYFEKFMFAACMMPVLLLSIFVLYKCKSNADGMKNRCIQMALTAVFLSYAFVSQAFFQGFACKQLGPEESYLAVDFQVSCESNEYIAFVVLGFAGVMAVPIGIPTVTLLVLLKNGSNIRSGGASYQRYQFLVGDYKPQFFFWDTLEMLRKVFITGLVMFVSPGSLMQLVVALVFCLGFLTSTAWLQPYGARAANMFKVGAESALSMMLILAIMLRFDLSNEDVTEGFVGTLMLFSSTILPGASLTIGVLSHGLDALDGIKATADEHDAAFDNPLDETNL
jgi:hypothetical protein